MSTLATAVPMLLVSPWRTAAHQEGTFVTAPPRHSTPDSASAGRRCGKCAHRSVPAGKAFSSTHCCPPQSNASSSSDQPTRYLLATLSPVRLREVKGRTNERAPTAACRSWTPAARQIPAGFTAHVPLSIQRSMIHKVAGQDRETGSTAGRHSRRPAAHSVAAGDATRSSHSQTDMTLQGVNREHAGTLLQHRSARTLPSLIVVFWINTETRLASPGDAAPGIVLGGVDA